MGYILKKNLMVGSVIHICFDVYLTDFFLFGFEIMGTLQMGFLVF